MSPENQRFQSIYAYRNNLPFPFLMDLAKECAADYHALAEDEAIVPTTYVVDREYTIRLAERGAPEVDQIVGVLQKLQAAE